MFGRATIRLGIGPHSSCLMSYCSFEVNCVIVIVGCKELSAVIKYVCACVPDTLIKIG